MTRASRFGRPIWARVIERRELGRQRRELLALALHDRRRRLLHEAGIAQLALGALDLRPHTLALRLTLALSCADVDLLGLEDLDRAPGHDDGGGRRAAGAI